MVHAKLEGFLVAPFCNCIIHMIKGSYYNIRVLGEGIPAHLFLILVGVGGLILLETISSFMGEGLFTAI